MRTRYKAKEKTPKRLNSRRALGRVTWERRFCSRPASRFATRLFRLCSLTFDRDHDEQERPRRRQPPRAR